MCSLSARQDTCKQLAKVFKEFGFWIEHLLSLKPFAKLRNWGGGFSNYSRVIAPEEHYSMTKNSISVFLFTGDFVFSHIINSNNR